MVTANKRVERVTADDASLTFPPISPDITTETVAVGIASSVTATSVENGFIPALLSKSKPIPGRKISLNTDEEKTHIKSVETNERVREAPIIKRAIGSAMPDTISSDRLMKSGNVRL